MSHKSFQVFFSSSQLEQRDSFNLSESFNKSMINSTLKVFVIHHTLHHSHKFYHSIISCFYLNNTTEMKWLRSLIFCLFCFDNFYFTVFDVASTWQQTKNKFKPASMINFYWVFVTVVLLNLMSGSFDYWIMIRRNGSWKNIRI